MTMDDAIEELFGAVMTAMDPEGRLYNYDFRLLPSKNVSCGSFSLGKVWNPLWVYLYRIYRNIRKSHFLKQSLLNLS